MAKTRRHERDEDTGREARVRLGESWARGVIVLAWSSTVAGAANLSDGHKTVLDQYGATNAAEFFAVATECFFEKPRQMQKKHPTLYAELKEFYRQDPVAYASPAAAPPQDRREGGAN